MRYLLIFFLLYGCASEEVTCDCQQITVKEEVYGNRTTVSVVKEPSDKCQDEEIQPRVLYYETDHVSRYIRIFVQCD